MSFLPNNILMTPGPSEVHPEVISAIARTQVVHYGLDWGNFYKETCLSLRPFFGTNQDPMLIFGSGSLAMEAGVANALNTGDEVINVITGYFGQRWEEMMKLRGLRVHSIVAPVGKTVPSETVEKTFKEHKSAKALVAVHIDTSSGVASPVDQYAEIAHRYGALTIIDAICSFGGAPIEMDKWGLDYCVGYPSKCLSSISGMTPYSMSNRYWDVVISTEHQAGWYVNLKVIKRFADDWGTWGHPYPTTVAVQPVIGLREAVKIVEREGLQNCFARHRRSGLAVRAAARAMELSVVASEDVAASTVSAIQIGDGLDKKIQALLLEKHNIQVGGGLLGPMIRIGHMGRSATPPFILATVSALESTLCDVGRKVQLGVGVAAAQEHVNE